MITFFRTRHLALQLKNNTVPDFHMFLYLVIPVLFESFVALLAGDLSELSYKALLRKLLVYGLGMTAMWFINSKGDNRRFIERVVCLSFPAFIKVNLLGFAYSFVTAIWHKMGIDIETQRLISAIFFTANSILFYFFVGYWLKQISQDRNVKLS